MNKPVGRLYGGNGNIIDIYAPEDGFRSKEHLEAWVTENLIDDVIYTHYLGVCDGNENNPRIICRAVKEYAMEMLSAEFLKEIAENTPEGTNSGVTIEEIRPGVKRIKVEVDLRQIVSSVLSFACGYASGRNDEAEARDEDSEEE